VPSSPFLQVTRRTTASRGKQRGDASGGSATGRCRPDRDVLPLVLGVLAATVAALVWGAPKFVVIDVGVVDYLMGLPGTKLHNENDGPCPSSRPSWLEF